MFRVLSVSSALRAAFALGLGGIAFTVGNLLLARVLPTEAYGVFTLVIGIFSVASLAAPWGLDLVISRRGLPLVRSLRNAVLRASLASGVLTALVALAYGMSLALAGALLVAAVAAGVSQAAVAHFQGQQRFGAASWLLQISNIALLPVAATAMIWNVRSAVAPAMVFAALGALGAFGTWRLMLSSAACAIDTPSIRTMWHEALSLLTITIASAVFLQLERLVLVPTLGVQALALFGVVAALVGSPFRMIQQAVLFTLIPGLRAAGSRGARRRLLAREMLLTAGAVSIGSVILWFVAPPLAHWLLAGRYELTDNLMLAAIVSGLLKVCSAFSTSVAVSLGEQRDLHRISATAWGSIGISVVGAMAASPWGLTGVLYGICAGWLARAIAATSIAVPYLLDRRSDLPYTIR